MGNKSYFLGGLLVLAFGLFPDFAAAKLCDSALISEVGYSGSQQDIENLNQLEISALSTRAGIFNGKFIDSRGKLITTTEPSQFVYNQDLEWLITRDSALVGHTQLGQGKNVIFAGMFEIKDGVITRILINGLSAYVGDVQNFKTFLNFLETEKVDLSQALFSFIYYEFSEAGEMQSFEDISRESVERLLAGEPN